MQGRHRFLSAVAAVVLLAACTENNPVSVEDRVEPTGPQLATPPVGPQWTLYTSQTPDQTLAASPGWEVGTRFRSSKSGKVIGFRFWRASGESGTNTAKLWRESGQLLASKSFSGSGTGWQTVYLTTAERVAIQANTNYRVSVNTNTAQVKRGGGYTFNGAISNGPLYSDAGYYGQPTGSMPTTGSNSYFFVDVIFEEDVPLPNLYVAAINPTLKDINGNEVVFVRVCNEGPGSTTRTTVAYLDVYWQGARQHQFYLDVPPLGPGQCKDHAPVYYSPLGFNEYHVRADFYDVEYESNENNYAYTNWQRNFY